MVLTYFFLHIEARRFVYYEASRHRARLLECNFFPEVLGEAVDPHWTASLVTALQQRAPRVSRMGAIGWRLRRNYLWFYGVVLLTWFSKLDIAGEPPRDLGAFVARAAIGSIPGWLVCAVVGVFYTWLIVVAVVARRMYPMGADDAGETFGTVTESSTPG
jgi:uncharacterized membrane protein